MELIGKECAPYAYTVFDNRFSPAKAVMKIGANSPKEAVKIAGFSEVEKGGGKIVKTRRGRGYTNTMIYVYFPETLAANAIADFTFKREF